MPYQTETLVSRRGGSPKRHLVITRHVVIRHRYLGWGCIVVKVGAGIHVSQRINKRFICQRAKKDGGQYVKDLVNYLNEKRNH